MTGCGGLGERLNANPSNWLPHGRCSPVTVPVPVYTVQPRCAGVWV